MIKQLQACEKRYVNSLNRLVTRLSDCQWANEHLDIFITGPTGVGIDEYNMTGPHPAPTQGFSVPCSTGATMCALKFCIPASMSP